MLEVRFLSFHVPHSQSLAALQELSWAIIESIPLEKKGPRKLLGIAACSEVEQAWRRCIERFSRDQMYCDTLTCLVMNVLVTPLPGFLQPETLFSGLVDST